MPILHQRLPRPSVLLAAALLVLAAPAARAASYLLVPMDLAQGNHLRAYGVAFHTLQAGDKVTWLLNYRGGSFLCDDTARVRLDARLLGVDFEELGEAQVAAIRAEVKQENMDEVLLETPPRIAVYSPPNKQPWDDAVTLALTYAEVPYDVVYDPDVLAGKLVLRFIETDLQAVGLQFGRLDRHLGTLQRGDDVLLQGLTDLFAARSGHLDHRILRVQIGQGVQKADQQHERHQHVLPQRILVKHCRTSGM